MKTFLILLMLCLPSLAFAADETNKRVNISKWISYELNQHVLLRSEKPLPKRQIRLYKKAYGDIREKFRDFSKINLQYCERNLEIRILPLEKINDRGYFPNEHHFSKGNHKVSARYFGNTNTMYMAPHAVYYNWKSTFAHEMAHHLFDACAVHFINGDIEHHVIHRFEELFE